MSVEYEYALAIGIVGALLGLMVWRIIQYRKGRVPGPEYDERQQLARGVAYRNGFHALCTYVIGYGILELLEIRFCEPYVAMMLGLLLAALVFAVTAIRRDAYVALHENRKKWLRWGYVLAALNLFTGGMAVAEGRLMEDGKLASPVVSLLLGLLWLVIVVVYQVHARRAAAEEQEDAS